MTITEFLAARVAEDELLLDASRAGEWIVFDRASAECVAKRAILEFHAPIKDEGWISGKDHDYLWCGACGSIDDSPEPYPCDTLKVLAAVYAGHPDYKPEWAL